MTKRISIQRRKKKKTEGKDMNVQMSSEGGICQTWRCDVTA